MKKNWICIVLSVLLLVSFVSTSGAMPPHKTLREEIKRGVKPVPFFLTDPAVHLKQRGINTGAKRFDGSRLYTAGAGPVGNVNVLALLVKFTDKPSQVAAASFDTLIFGAAGNTVRVYYQEVSYGTLTLVTVNLPSSLDWGTAPNTYAYYTANNYGLGSYPRNAQKLVEDIVDLVDSYVDFSQYDNDGDGQLDALTVVHAGPGAEFTGSTGDIWSHQWGITPRLKDGVYISNYSMEPEYMQTPGDATIGVFAHELGHVFGLPDLYDYGYDSAGAGDWSLMAGGSWNGTNGSSPAHFDAWSRSELGFVTPQVVSANTTGVNIPAVETSPSVFYVWNSGLTNNEYFLVENRQKTGYDASLPGSGMLIWHIDENMASNDSQCLNMNNCSCPSHYKVALEQADGLLQLEKNQSQGNGGDPFPGTSNKTSFSSSSTPNSGSYLNCTSSVAVTNISASASVMTADIQVTGVSLPSVSGAVSYSGTKTGAIRILAYTNSGFSGTPAYSASISAPGAYTISSVASGTYYFLSYRDSNGDSVRQATEAFGLYGTPGAPTAVVVNGTVTGIDITIYDPASMSGTISYSGTVTGRIYIEVFNNPSFTGTAVYSTTIPQPGTYRMRGLLPGTYYVRSYRDTNRNRQYNTGEPYGTYGTVTINPGSNVTGINITLN
ncbi:MAG: M6 family metalloprotease domain-containing protein [Nitrospirae bacterium]|nr:M6 family metalloprotease domain-containing protein [Nitrospirota bacterium]